MVLIATSHRNRWSAAMALLLSLSGAATTSAADEVIPEVLQVQYGERVLPFLRQYCFDCHGERDPEAKLDLSRYRSASDVSAAHPTWEILLRRLHSAEMPPADTAPQPPAHERKAVIDWINALRRSDAERSAGDPGSVPVRRLSHAEYNNSTRDLTGVDLRPTGEFPVDPANEAGFDNSGESLTISPALLGKYFDAARMVAEHLVFTPSGLSFAPHPVVTETDRDKYCVKRIVAFYQSQPTDIADYIFVCWKQAHENGDVGDSLRMRAQAAGISGRYAATVWELLHQPEAVGVIAALQSKFRDLPDQAEAAQHGCEALREYVLELRQLLAPRFENLEIEEVHKGSQPFVLWKNEQYAAHRRTLSRQALFFAGAEIPDDTRPELILPHDSVEQRDVLRALEEFCAVFPDAFYISERGRDYLNVPRDEQEKGRLLSAGFHSMMGYFRDDTPLCELILEPEEAATLDRLWQELDYVTEAPLRQYQGFLWFERTDSRYMRDPVFDFARPENRAAAREPTVRRLAELYLEKARRNGGEGVALQAIADYFENINHQIRRVESARKDSEQLHREQLLDFARRAWRRPLDPTERAEILRFYRELQDEDGLTHEEAIRESLTSLLVSPFFLYRVDLLTSGPNSRPLDDFELASRLSYFLWSSCPDEELLQMIESEGEQLRDPDVLISQTRRMLADPKFRGFAIEFGTNWLDVRRFEEHNSVDRERFPEFTDELRAAMWEEPVRYLTDLVQHNRPILDLLEGQHTFVNRVLADHYGIDGLNLSANEWVRVEDAQSFGRGGLLPMAVFLTKNSPGLRTSPVKRGYWVVRQLLGERIPPPPPNVPDLPEDESALGDLSLRELLAKHREHASCAGCHNRFDGIGLAFEGYGPVGERRSEDLGGRPVQLLADFPSGTEGAGIDGVRDYLTQHRQQDFVDSFCRKLLAYSLGRTLLLSDEPLLAKMKERMKQHDHRFQCLIDTIVTSRQFLTKRGAVDTAGQN